MALTRKMLKAMGIDEEKIDQIIEEHVASVDALKEQRDTFKAQAQEVEDLKKQLEEAVSGDDYRTKYEAVVKDFEDFKATAEKDRQTQAKKELFKALLVEAGIDRKRIDTVVKVSDMDSFDVKDGAIVDADKLTEAIKGEWADFVVQTSTQGANVSNPPSGDPVSYEDMSMDEYVKARSAH